jgi:hypothetical protein
MVKNLTKGKLVYMSLDNCRALRVIGKKYPDKRSGRPLSYNKAVSLLFEILTPGFIIASEVKNKLLSLENDDENKGI